MIFPHTPTRNPLPEQQRCRVATALTPVLCNVVALETHAHQARWNTRGTDALSARKRFRSLARAAANWSESVACRLAQLGFAVGASVRQAAGGATLDDYPSILASGTEHAALLADRIAQLDRSLYSAIVAAEESHDHVTLQACSSLVGEVEAALQIMEACQPLPPVEAPRSRDDAANREPRDAVEEASIESFPASDPPASRAGA